jgi:hypothetical protein
MVVLGMAISLTYLNLLKNAWRYFPDKKGTISGFILGAYGLSAMVFTSIADAVINPDSHTTDDYGIYTKEVADNFHLFIMISIIIFIAIGVIGMCLVVPYEEDNYIVLEQEINETKTMINTKADSNQEYVNNTYIIIDYCSR